MTLFTVLGNVILEKCVIFLAVFWWEFLFL